MSVFVVQKKSIVGGSGDGLLAPAGSEILWYGIASQLSGGWAVSDPLKGKFVEAAGVGQASDVSQGSNSHSHTNPNTGSGGSHNHSYGSGSVAYNAGLSKTQATSSTNSSGAVWQHTHSFNAGATSSNGDHYHTVGNTDTETVYPPYHRLYFVKASAQSGVPVGGIIMWGTALAGIPTGFHLCDGGTYDGMTVPDLRDRFIYGAAADGDVNARGGSEAHTHGQPLTNTGGGHTHTISGTTTNANTKAVSTYEGVQVQKSHSHGIDATTSSDPNHAHTISDTGSGSHVPLYVKLYFIIRTV